jgi:endo-1,4-beta-xylanase
MKKKSFMLIVLLATIYLISCSKKDGNTVQTQENNAAATTALTQAPATGDTDAQGSTEGDTAAVTPTEVPVAATPVVVDGYDITASVTGTPLKDAYADYFKIGVGINGSSPENASTRSAAMTEIIKYHFNSVTYSNLMKPSYLLDQQGSIKNFAEGKDEPAVKFDTVKEGLEFCKANNIQMRGHVLVWHNQVPDWFFRVGYQNNGDYVDKDTMLARLESYIKQVLTYTQTEYPGVIYCWDVVNEAVENSTGAYETESGFQIRSYYDGSKENLWYKVIGVDYVEKSFEYARKYADPEVKLFYNDYNTFQPTKTILIYNLVSSLKEKGLIDGIGMQGYMDLTYPGIAGGQDSFMTALSKFAELGLEIQLTELTIRSDDKSPESMEKQAKRYESLFQILKGMDTAGGRNANITAVTVFGLMDEYLFYTNDKTYARLFDGKLQPKPAFYSILGVAEKQ